MKKITILLVAFIILFGFNLSNQTVYTSQQLDGKVIKAYKAEGYGPRHFEWLFMDIKTNKGIVKVAIAPIFRISNLPIKEGDEVKVSGFFPPYWSGTMKAWDIYDVSQQQDYPISGYGCCRR